MMLSGEDVAETILDFVRRQNVTQIVIGRSRPNRLGAFWRRSLPRALMEGLSGAALHVITHHELAEDTRWRLPRLGIRREWRGGAVALLSVGSANGVASLVDQFNKGANLAMIFLVSVLVTGLGFGLWPALLASGLAALTFNFFFLEPRLSMVIGNPADLFTFAVFFGAALVAGGLAGRVRDQAAAAERRASAVTALLVASQNLSAVATRDEAARTLAAQLAAAGSGMTVVLLPLNGEIEIAAGAPFSPALDATVMTAARWAWQRGEAAGAGTGTLPQIDWTFLPLQGLRERVGVAGVEAGRLRRGSEEERLLRALLGQGAVAIERADLAAGAVPHGAELRSE
jgi:two-component system sensor histidine kinase KdpD